MIHKFYASCGFGQTRSRLVPTLPLPGFILDTGYAFVSKYGKILVSQIIATIKFINEVIYFRHGLFLFFNMHYCCALERKFAISNYYSAL